MMFAFEQVLELVTRASRAPSLFALAAAMPSASARGRSGAPTQPLSSSSSVLGWRKLSRLLLAVAPVSCCLRMGRGGPERSALALRSGKSRRRCPHGSGRADVGDSGGPWWPRKIHVFGGARGKGTRFKATASRVRASVNNACCGSPLYRDLVSSPWLKWAFMARS